MLRDGGSDNQNMRRRLFDALRRVGVRTATDLDRAGRTGQGKARLAKALSKDITRPQLDLVLGSIADAQWMPNLRRWRENPDPAHRTVFLNGPISPCIVDVSTNGNGNGHGGTVKVRSEAPA